MGGNLSFDRGSCHFLLLLFIVTRMILFVFCKDLRKSEYLTLETKEHGHSIRWDHPPLDKIVEKDMLLARP